MIWHPFTAQVNADEPLKIVRAEKEYIYDAQGRDYVDAIASWWTMIHGHRHPAIVAAIEKQLATLDHVLLAGFTHDAAEQLADKLLDASGRAFSHVLFSDNGSGAVEIMLKLAVQYYQNTGNKGRRLFIKFDSAYHGDTFGAMAVGGASVFTQPYQELLFATHSLPYPTGNAASVVLSELEIFLQQHEEEVAAIIIEPLIAAAGGMVFHTSETLRQIAQLAAEYNVLLLCDEVFTGMGRSGVMLACQQAGIVPDMLALAKGLTGGSLPLAVTLVSEKIHSAFLSDDPAKTFYHGHTMTGNPVGCAAALASLELLQSENRLDQVRRLEGMMQSQWQRLLMLHGGKIASPRALGAVSAANLVSSTGASGYTSAAGKELRRVCLAEGVIIRPLGDVIYVTPPYNISDAALERTFAAIDKALKSYEPN